MNFALSSPSQLTMSVEWLFLLLLASAILIVLTILTRGLGQFLFLRADPVDEIMGKKRKKIAAKESSKNEDNANNNTKGCMHIDKSTDPKCVKNLKQSPCDICVKLKTTPNNQVSGPWICLKCGAKTCSREHGLQHYQTPRSDSHALVIDISNKTVWCYQCNAQVPANSKKKLNAIVRELESVKNSSNAKIAHTPSVPVDSVQTTTYSKINVKKSVKSIKESRETSSAVGLVNEGNTCYANSVLQCLARTPHLEETIRNEFANPVRLTLDDGVVEYTCGCNLLIEEYLKLHGTLGNENTDKTKVTSAIAILRQLTKKHPHFKWDQQHDAHEFLRLLLDTLRSAIYQSHKNAILAEKNLNSPVQKKNASSELTNEIKEIDQKLRDFKDFGPENVFGGQLVSRLQCMECDFTSESIEKFMDLSLPVITIETELTPIPKKQPEVTSRKRHYRPRRQRDVRTERAIKDDIDSWNVNGNKRADDCIVENYETNDEIDDQRDSYYKMNKADKKECFCDQNISENNGDVKENEDDKNSNINGFNDSGINDSDHEIHRSESESEANEIRTLCVSSSDEHMEEADYYQQPFTKADGSNLSNSISKDDIKIENIGPSESKETDANEVGKADSADSALHETSVSNEINASEGGSQKGNVKESQENIENNFPFDVPSNEMEERNSISEIEIGCRNENDPTEHLCGQMNKAFGNISTKSQTPDPYELEGELATNSTDTLGLEYTCLCLDCDPEKYRDVSAWVNNSEWQVEGSELPFCEPIPPVYCNNKQCPSSHVYGQKITFEEDGRPQLSSMVFGKEKNVIELTKNVNLTTAKDDSLVTSAKQKVDDYFAMLPDGSYAGSRKLSEALSYLESYTEAVLYSPDSCDDLSSTPFNDAEDREVQEAFFNNNPETKDNVEIVGEKMIFQETLESISNEERESDEGLCISNLYDIEEFSEVEMKITKVENENYNDSSLEKCLQEFIRKEILTGSNKVGCSACTARANKGNPEGKTVYTSFSKQLLIKNTPEVIILHLKRFQVQMSSVHKVNCQISFPVILNMAPFCVQVEGKEKKEDLYHLFGVVKHSGYIDTGHYEAYVAHFGKDAFKSDGSGETCKPQVQWYLANDRHVTPVTERQVLSTQAYLLFYRQMPS